MDCKILFLCTKEDITRERKGLVRCLKDRCRIKLMDQYRSSGKSFRSYIEKNNNFHLAIYTDISRAYLPEGVEKLPFPTACFQIDAYASPVNRAKMSRLFDLVLPFHPSYTSLYEAYHPEVRAFPHAIPRNVYQAEYSTTEYDVSTIGRLDGPDYAYRRSAVDTLRSMDVRTNNMAEYHPYAKMVEVYGKSKITINVSRGDHLSLAHLSCIEILGAGTLLLTTCDPSRQEPHELEALGFEEGRHFVTFGSIADMKQKISYYLQRDNERREIAERAREETLENHTYQNRASQLLKWIDQGIQRRAPAREMSKDEVASIYVDYFSKRGHIDKTLHHLGRQREAGGARWPLLKSMGKATKATVRGWQRALLS